MKKIFLFIVCFCSFVFGDALTNFSPDLNVITNRINTIVQDNINIPYEEFCYSNSHDYCFKVTYSYVYKTDGKATATFTIEQIFYNSFTSNGNHLVPDTAVKDPVKLLSLIDFDPKSINSKSSLFLETNQFISINNTNYKEYEPQLIFLFIKYFNFLRSSFDQYDKVKNKSLMDLKTIK